MSEFVNCSDDRLDDICEALEHVVDALNDLRKLMPEEGSIYQMYSDLYTEALIEQSHRTILEFDALSRQYEEMSRW